MHIVFIIIFIITNIIVNVIIIIIIIIIIISIINLFRVDSEIVIFYNKKIRYDSKFTLCTVANLSQ